MIALAATYLFAALVVSGALKPARALLRGAR